MISRILLLLFFISCTTLAQTSPTATRIDSLLTAYQQAEKFNGNVLVANEGEIIINKSYGFADFSEDRKLTPNSVFELASVSKQFTAMGILLSIRDTSTTLSDRGSTSTRKQKLQLDDPITKYFPELSFYEGVTIDHLVHHTSGLPDYMELFQQHWNKSKIAVNQDIVDLLAEHKPEKLFEPGEKFEYSNTGYALLGLIIEKVNGISFGEFLDQNIFKPLEMNRTEVYRSRFAPKTIEDYAQGYIMGPTGEKILPDALGTSYLSYYLDGIVGDGMVNSTTGDLLKWDQALRGDQFLSEDEKELLYKGFKLRNGEVTNYGFGIFAFETEKGFTTNHSGGWAGYVTFFEQHMDTGYTIIILQNVSTPLTKNPVRPIRQILYNEPLDQPKRALEYTMEELERYVGTYKSPEFPLDVKIFVDDNVLMAQATGQAAFALTSFEKDRFVFEMAGIDLRFDTAKNKMELRQAGNFVVMYRNQ